MASWYTIDPHFIHEKMLSSCDRPLKSVDQVDAISVEKMRPVVKPEDDFWIVESFVFGIYAKYESKFTTFCEKLHGAVKLLVLRNHDLLSTPTFPWDSLHHLVEVRDRTHRQAHTLCHHAMHTWNPALHKFAQVRSNQFGSRNAVRIGADVWDFMTGALERIIELAGELPPNKHLVDVVPGVDER